MTNKVMQTAGLSDRELVPWVVATVVSVVGSVDGVVSLLLNHESISEPYVSDQLRLSLADSIALLAASVAAPRSVPSTNSLNCQECKSKQNNYNEMLRSMITHIVI